MGTSDTPRPGQLQPRHPLLVPFEVEVTDRQGPGRARRGCARGRVGLLALGLGLRAPRHRASCPSHWASSHAPGHWSRGLEDTAATYASGERGRAVRGRQGGGPPGLPPSNSRAGPGAPLAHRRRVEVPPHFQLAGPPPRASCGHGLLGRGWPPAFGTEGSLRRRPGAQQRQRHRHCQQQRTQALLSGPTRPIIGGAGLTNTALVGQEALLGGQALRVWRLVCAKALLLDLVMHEGSGACLTASGFSAPKRPFGARALTATRPSLALRRLVSDLRLLLPRNGQVGPPVPLSFAEEALPSPEEAWCLLLCKGFSASPAVEHLECLEQRRRGTPRGGGPASGRGGAYLRLKSRCP